VKKDYINNILVILLTLFIFFGIGYLIYKDISNIKKHLENCKKECYPARVVEQYSRKYCFCQTFEETLNK